MAKLLTTREVAALCGLSRQAVCVAVRKGYLTPARSLDSGNLFDRAAVAAYRNRKPLRPGPRPTRVIGEAK